MDTSVRAATTSIYHILLTHLKAVVAVISAINVNNNVLITCIIPMKLRD